MVYALVTNFLLTFILFTQNLNASQLAAVTAIMIGARVFDALNDPVMGNIIEKTRTGWGKFKPYLLSGILLTSLVIFLMFNVPLEGWAFVIFFGVIYFSYSIAYTMHDISYWGMIPALSSDRILRHRRFCENSIRPHCPDHCNHCASVPSFHNCRGKGGQEGS